MSRDMSTDVRTHMSTTPNPNADRTVEHNRKQVA